MTKISTLIFTAAALLTVGAVPALADNMAAQKPTTGAMADAMAPHHAVKHAKHVPAKPAAHDAMGAMGASHGAMGAAHAKPAGGAMVSPDSHM